MFMCINMVHKKYTYIIPYTLYIYIYMYICMYDPTAPQIFAKQTEDLGESTENGELCAFLRLYNQQRMFNSLGTGSIPTVCWGYDLYYQRTQWDADIFNNLWFFKYWWYMKIVLDYSSLKTSHCPLVIKHCLLENPPFTLIFPLKQI